MSAAIARAAELAHPYRWWLLLTFLAGPLLWALGVRYLLTMPGFISAEADWLLLKFSAVIAAWSWGLYLLALFFHPVRGFLCAQRRSLLVAACRVLFVFALALLFLSPALVFSVAP